MLMVKLVDGWSSKALHHLNPSCSLFPSTICIIWKSPNWLVIQTSPALDGIAVLPETGFQLIYRFPSDNNVGFYKAFNDQNGLWTKQKPPEIDRKSFMNRLFTHSYICLHKPGSLTICPQIMAYFTKRTRTRTRTFRKS